jgi:glutamate 5-kinase
VRGQLIIDDGAASALTKQNRSLLAAGIKQAKGSFERGDTVDIFDASGRRLGCGIVNYGADELCKIVGARSDKIGEILRHNFGAEVVHRNNLVLV